MMAQVRVGSGFGRIRVPSAKATEEFCGGHVFFTYLGLDLFYALYYQQRDSTALVVVIREWFLRINMWTNKYADVLTQMFVTVE